MTIGVLSDKLLLGIFRYYLDASPHHWLRLVHICTKWRRIVFASQRALHLRLFCTRGTRVLSTLDCWPTLPIVVCFEGSPALDPDPEDEVNITAALKQSGRVSSISLIVTSSFLETFSTIKEPFSNLEDLVLLSRDSAQLTLPSTFRCGPCLRSLHLTKVAFPAHMQLLYSSRNLVDLQLHEIVNFAPEAFVNALSQMDQLRYLSLHFLSRADSFHSPFPSGERPALTHFDLREINTYSEGLVTRINAPGLRDIEITFFDKRIFYVPKLLEFVDRIKMQKSPRWADILSSERAISISLTQQGAPTRLRLRVLCKTSRLQPFCVAQICTFFSAFLFRVEDIRISTTQLSSAQDDNNCEQWLRTIRQFSGAKWLHIAGEHLTNVVRALQLSDKRRETVLPVLHKICIQEPAARSALSQDALVPFMRSCWLSGRFIAVEYERLWTNGLREKGTTDAQCRHLTLTCFEQDLFQTGQQLRFSPTTSF